jgi:DNA-binding response OmpR family regulator
MKVLFVEDNIEICEMLGSYLTAENFEVDCAYDGEQACQKFDSDTYHIVLLDLMIPKISGMDVMKHIRKSSTVPIIIISAKDTEVDKTLGLGLGADDYITKPFSVVEVLARVKANIRRTTEYAAPLQEPEELSFRSLKMDLSNHTVTKNGVLLELTAKEFDILKLLLQNPKRVYTKAQIYSLIWNDVYVGDENAVNVHISRLRNKIEDNPRSPECVLTVWGIGYKLGEPT